MQRLNTYGGMLRGVVDAETSYLVWDAKGSCRCRDSILNVGCRGEL